MGHTPLQVIFSSAGKVFQIIYLHTKIWSM